MTAQHQNNQQNNHQNNSSNQHHSNNAFHEFLYQFTWEILITLLFSICGAIFFLGMGFILLFLPYIAIIYYLFKRKQKDNQHSD